MCIVTGNMKQTDIIIIGAGAAGLMTAYTLVKAGKSVIILEARDRIGGRIHTFSDGHHFKDIELGAEFVHGNLPVTLGLLKEAGIKSNSIRFEMLRYFNGKFEQSEELVDGWEEFMEKINQLQQDMTLHDFLNQYFPGEKYTAMRTQLTGYVNGYDTADLLDVSTFALREEWNNEDEEAQHRVAGGYTTLLAYMAQYCRDNGSEVLLNKVAREISWQENKVQVTTTDNTVYEAGKVVIALPLGVLQAKDAIVFNPAINEAITATKNIGFGAVIKILMKFNEAFWEKEDAVKAAGDTSATKMLLLAGKTVPTFWTTPGAHPTLLTGWLGGPPAYERKDLSDTAIIQLALETLGAVFNCSLESLKDKLTVSKVVNWITEPYTLGSYAYDKVESTAARKILNQPVADTLYFAGEYLYSGPTMGTVEAALTSGKNTAGRLLKNAV